ncbi:MAG TPA: carbohydrate ABC transporter permease [Mobilitalea sp.]|nr:carbohydrate ABC transporter permease [Mobilitalea sp.]
MNKTKSIRNKFRKDKPVMLKPNMSFRDRNKLSNNYLLKKSIGSFIFRICRAIMLFGLCFLILQPILSKISVSFMDEQDLYDATIINIPRNFTKMNYEMASTLMNYGSALKNTLWVSLVIALVQVASTTLVGYGFARYKFPFKKFWFGAVVLSIVIPPQTILTALYLNFRYFDLFGLISLFGGKPINLLNTLLPYVMISAGAMGLKNGLYIFMLRQYFRGIPKELEEAAYVDGCGKFKTFLVIMLPDAKPMLTSIFLFSYVWQWTDTFYSSLFLRKFGLLSNAVAGVGDGLSTYIQQISNRTSLPSMAYTQAIISTGTLMIIAPLIIIYLVAQKGFVESLAQAGIKM